MAMNRPATSHYERICVEQSKVPAIREQIICECEEAARTYIDWLTESLGWKGPVRFFVPSQMDSEDDDPEFSQEMISCFEPGQKPKQLKVGVAFRWPAGIFLDVLIIERAGEIPQSTVEFAGQKIRIPGDFSEDHVNRVFAKMLNEVRLSILDDYDWGKKKTANSAKGANALASHLVDSNAGAAAATALPPVDSGSNTSTSSTAPAKSSEVASA